LISQINLDLKLKQLTSSLRRFRQCRSFEVEFTSTSSDQPQPQHPTSHLQKHIPPTSRLDLGRHIADVHGRQKSPKRLMSDLISLFHASKEIPVSWNELIAILTTQGSSSVNVPCSLGHSKFPNPPMKLLNYRKDGANCFTIPLNFDWILSLFRSACRSRSITMSIQIGLGVPKESHSAVLGIKIPKAYSIGTGTR
jgi:hypothetical protein